MLKTEAVMKTLRGEDVFRYVMETMAEYMDLSRLYQKTWEKFGLPVILTDISYRLIAYGGPRPCPDPYWDDILVSGIAAPKVIIENYYKDGYMDQLSAHEDPFTVDWGVSTDMPQTTCGVRVRGNLNAITSVLFVRRDLEELALEINAALRSAAEVLLAAGRGRMTESNGPERMLAARILLEDTEAPAEVLKNIGSYGDLALTPGYVILAVCLRTPVAGRLQNLRGSLKQREPTLLYSTREDHVLLFFKGVRDQERVEQIMATIEKEAKGKGDFVCGVSGIFDDLEQRAAYVEQALLSMEYGRERASGHRFYFRKLYTEILCRVGSRNMKRENLVLPELRQLKDLDRENDTNFFDSFKCYLYEKCDLSKTAALLFMHRNSLAYRIKRCQEIMNIDLTDRAEYERFYLCCRILDMQEE